MSAFFILLSLFIPVFIIFLTVRYKIFRSIGPVLLCYLAGILAGNSGLIPHSLQPLQTSLSEGAVALSLPLLLFSLDVKQWFRMAGKAIISMTLAIIAVVTVSTTIWFFMKDGGSGSTYELAGMAMGAYTGGTPNLAAIKTALNIENSRYLLFHSYDVVFSLFYIFLVLSFGKKYFHHFLPKQKQFDSLKEHEMKDSSSTESEFGGIFRKSILLPLAGALGAGILIIVISIGISLLFPPATSSAITILSITSLSIGASFIPRIRNIKRTFPTGMYIIYIFSFVIASLTDFSNLAHLDYRIMLFVFLSIFGSMALHALFSRILKIDADTFIVTSVSAICSPPFVPVVAGVLKDPSVLLSGITTGIIGYAVGNYLGISLAMILQHLT